MDSDSFSAKLMRLILEGDGYETRSVASAEEALAVVDVFGPGLIILDLVLPHMSGLLLAERLKANERTRGIVLVAVSTFEGREIEGLCATAGFRAYYRKPVDAVAFPRWLLAILSST